MVYANKKEDTSDLNLPVLVQLNLKKNYKSDFFKPLKSYLSVLTLVSFLD